MPDWDHFYRFAVTDGECCDAARAALPLPPMSSRARAAVLVGMYCAADGVMQVVLTRRSETLAQHAGQIAFPGGKIEARDADNVTAALRETEEEIGVAARHIDVFGELPLLPTLTGFAVSPVLARIRSGQWRANPAEVAEIFTVPAAFALDVAQYRQRVLRHHHHVLSSPVLPYRDYDIWGVTAAILYRLAVSFARFDRGNSLENPELSFMNTASDG